MRVGIIARTDRKDALEIAKKAIEFLSDTAEVLVEKTLASKLRKKFSNLINADIVIAIGGDGTILRALRSYNVPLLGVKAGAVGFLAEVQSVENLKDALAKILAGKYKIESRIKLKTILSKERLPDATNEVVVHTAKVAKICNFKVEINSHLQEIAADGIIIATPTGSTSYAFSVGAPVIDSKLKAFVLAPIAPFRQLAKPLVIGAESEIKISLLKGKDWILAIDGQYERKLNAKDKVTMSISDKQAQFVRLK